MNNRHIHILQRVWLMLTIGMSALLMAGCQMWQEPEGDVSDVTSGEDYIYLALDIANLADNSETRAGANDDSADHGGHPVEVATADENYINLNDIKLMLFDDKDRLIRIIDKSEYSITVDSEDNKHYTIYPRIHGSYFDYAGENEINFSLLLVTNLGYYNFNPTYFSSITEISQTYKGYSGYDFNNSDLKGAFIFITERWAGNNLVAWAPSQKDNIGVPMSGYKRFKFTRAQLEGSTEEDPYIIGTIDVQRALGKFRFLIDMENIEKNNMAIEKVQIPEMCKYATYLPDLSKNSGWLDNHCNIENPTYLADWSDQLNEAPAITFDKEVIIDGKRYKKFEIYTVEYSHDYLPAVEFKLTDTSSKDSNVEFTYLSDLKDFKSLEVMRNHIYEFTVTADPKEPKKLQMDYNVCKWIDKSADISFN